MQKDSQAFSDAVDHVKKRRYLEVLFGPRNFAVRQESDIQLTAADLLGKS